MRGEELRRPSVVLDFASMFRVPFPVRNAGVGQSRIRWGGPAKEGGLIVKLDDEGSLSRTAMTATEALLEAFAGQRV